MLKTGPVLLRNMLGPAFNAGPVFNASLDQFLKLGFFVFFCVFFLFFLAEIPIFIVFSAKMQNLKKHKKEKHTLFVSTPVLTALVKMSVFFFLHFSFLFFLQFPIFSEMFFDRFQKIKK